VTGAPLGLVDFNDVAYWPQIERIVHWAKEHVTSTLFVCWAVQAALNVLYGVPKMTREVKLSGVYQHQTLRPHALLTRGFDETFLAPHSRYADFPADVLHALPDLDILAESEEAGPYLFATKDKRMAFVTGHPEYDAGTLGGEYLRDAAAGLEPTLPVNYFPQDNPDLPPKASWRSHGHLLFSNWLNYYVYQITPFDLRQMNPTLD
jgi:homoserine O-succinyltransferase